MGTRYLKAELFGGLFILSNKLQTLGDQIDHRISTKQWLLLAVLCREPDMQSSLSTLAEKMGTSRQNVKKLALILEQKGFLTLQKPEEDRRVVLIRPTEACLTHLKQREQKEIMFIDQFYEGFSEEQLRGIKVAFEQWMRNLQSMEKCYEKEN